MNDDRKDYPKIEEEFGLNMTMDEALQRFSRVTKEELAGEKNLPAKIPDGELELVPFKKEAIRRVCHNDEWWYSVIDVVTALTDSSRGRKYWSDLKTRKQIETKTGQRVVSSQNFLGKGKVDTALPPSR